MARPASKDQEANNKAKCGANRFLFFRGAVAFDAEDSYTGKDVVYLDLLFSEGISFRLFNPRENVAKRGVLAATLGSLCTALGDDFNNVPGCFQWEDFAVKFQEFVDPYKLTKIYVKVTLNSNRWLIPGTGKCFSNTNDMEYSDADLLFLETPDGDLAHPGEKPKAGDDDLYGDLPF